MYNSKKIEIIQKHFDENINSHSYLFYTNDFLKCKKDLEILLKHIFKNNNLNALENDFVSIKKSEKKDIQKEEIIKIKKLIFNTSYINEKRIYLIEEVDKLNSISANMILKFLEEPTKNVIAFFITTNIELVLTTIKSRCQIVNVIYDNGIIYNNDSIEIIDDFIRKDKFIALFEAKNYFKKYDRNELIILLQNYSNYLAMDLNNKDNFKLIKKINKVLNLLNKNVNVDYAFDVLFLEGD